MDQNNSIQKFKARKPAISYILVGIIMTALRYEDILNYGSLDIYQKGFMYFWIIFTLVGIYTFFSTMLEIDLDYFILKGHIKKLNRKITVDQMTNIELDNKKIVVSFKDASGYELPVKIPLNAFFERDKASIVAVFQKWKAQLISSNNKVNETL